MRDADSTAVHAAARAGACAGPKHPGRPVGFVWWFVGVYYRQPPLNGASRSYRVIVHEQGSMGLPNKLRIVIIEI